MTDTLSRFTDIRDADLRGRDGLFCVESPRIVRRFLHALLARHAGSACPPALGLDSLLLTPEHAAELEPLIAQARSALPPFAEAIAPEDQISRTTGYALHRGAVALGRRSAAGRTAEGTVDALLAGGARTVIACDGVVHVDNVGSLLRNAGSFGGCAVLFGPGCGDPLSRKAIRISSGRAFTVPWCQAPSWPDDLLALRSAHGFALIACEDADGALAPSEALASVRARGAARVAWVMGAEGAGIPEGLLRACDAVACIPMRLPPSGPGNPVPLEHDDRPSLNVAVASAVVLHEACRADAHAGSARR